MIDRTHFRYLVGREPGSRNWSVAEQFSGCSMKLLRAGLTHGPEAPQELKTNCRPRLPKPWSRVNRCRDHCSERFLLLRGQGPPPDLGSRRGHGAAREDSRGHRRPATSRPGKRRLLAPSLSLATGPGRLPAVATLGGLGQGWPRSPSSCRQVAPCVRRVDSMNARYPAWHCMVAPTWRTSRQLGAPCCARDSSCPSAVSGPSQQIS